MILRALSLWRPWPDAILRNTKRVENRGWPPPRPLRGQLLALHAGQRYQLGEWPADSGWTPPPNEQCPTGIVGVARVVGCVMSDPSTPMRPHVEMWVRPDDLPDASEAHVSLLRWYQPGGYGWLLGSPIAIRPVPCVGRQGVWRLPVGVADRVCHELRCAGRIGWAEECEAA